MSAMRPARRAAAALALAATAALPACVRATSMIDGQRRFYAYSWAEEVRLGREADAELVKEYGLYDDPALTAYVARVGEAVLAESHMRRAGADSAYRATPVTFRVLDSPVVNAFALPGGYVYVTRGLLAHLENEAQLAVVLGHEVAHVTARHTSQRMVETSLAMIGVVGAAILGETLGGRGQEVAAVGMAGMQLLLFSHSRGHERESDRLGVEYATLAGYRAAEGAGFFTLLGRMGEGAGWLPTFLSTHPDPGRREASVRQLAGEWATRRDSRAAARGAAAPVLVANEDPFLRAIDGVVFGDDPRQGYVEGDAFVHPERRFRLALPAGWRLQHARAQLQLTDTAGPGTGLVLREEAARGTAREAADAYLARRSELTVVRRGPDRVNGLAAHTVEAVRAASDTSRLLLTFVEHEGAVYLLGGVAPRDRWADVAPALGRAIGSFAPLGPRDASRAGVAPTRLRVRRVERDTPFRALLPARLPRGVTAEALALANGVRVDDVIPAGRRVKLPG